MRTLFLVGLGGCIGAIGRYTLGEFVKSRVPAYPYAGTFAVNMIGCLLIGFVMQLAAGGSNTSQTARLFVVTGCLGALTTFSTFGFETLKLVQENRFAAAGTNIVGNVVVGLIAVWVGMQAAGLFVSVD